MALAVAGGVLPGEKMKLASGIEDAGCAFHQAIVLPALFAVHHHKLLGSFASHIGNMPAVRTEGETADAFVRALLFAVHHDRPLLANIEALLADSGHVGHALAVRAEDERSFDIEGIPAIAFLAIV